MNRRGSFTSPERRCAISCALRKRQERSTVKTLTCAIKKKEQEQQTEQGTVSAAAGRDRHTARSVSAIILCSATLKEASSGIRRKYIQALPHLYHRKQKEQAFPSQKPPRYRKKYAACASGSGSLCARKGIATEISLLSQGTCRDMRMTSRGFARSMIFLSMWTGPAGFSGIL